ncbi:MAG: hypothetical protein IKT57_00230 [Clostridia bacterium]|nr:hypothetical protein [Clostridia bacterium]
MNIAQAYAWGKTKEGVRAARLFMDRPRMIENRLTLVFARMDRLRERIAPVMYAEAVRAGTASGDRTGQLASQLCDLECEAEKLLHELTIVRKLRKEILEALPDNEAGQAVGLIYLEHLTQLAASRRMFMDERQFVRRLRQGMELVATHLKMREEEYLQAYRERILEQRL